MESAKKYDVSVSTETQYIADQSDESKDRFVFSYTVTIRNSGTVPARYRNSDACDRAILTQCARTTLPS